MYFNIQEKNLCVKVHRWQATKNIPGEMLGDTITTEKIKSLQGV